MLSLQNFHLFCLFLLLTQNRLSLSLSALSLISLFSGQTSPNSKTSNTNPILFLLLNPNLNPKSQNSYQMAESEAKASETNLFSLLFCWVLYVCVVLVICVVVGLICGL
jgi:hypothetical protein